MMLITAPIRTFYGSAINGGAGGFGGGVLRNVITE